MPRGVGAQHADELRRLGDAAMRVVARGGLPSLTFRNAAAEAGVSPGRVQHYARTSNGLVAIAFRRVQERVAARVRSGLESLREPTPVEIVGSTLAALIPGDEEARVMLQVAAAVEVHALADPDLADELRTGRRGLIDFLAEQLVLAAPRPAPSARRDATALLGFAEGLSSLVLTGTTAADEARRLLRLAVRAATRAARVAGRLADGESGAAADTAPEVRERR